MFNKTKRSLVTLSLSLGLITPTFMNVSADCIQTKTDQPITHRVSEQSPGFSVTPLYQSTTNPLISTLAFHTTPISIGLKYTYNNKKDGKSLKNLLSKCSTTDGAIGIGGALAAVGIETGPLDGVLLALGTLSAAALHSRFKEAAALVNKHPNKGVIYLYLDHVTYRK